MIINISNIYITIGVTSWRSRSNCDYYPFGIFI